MCDSKFYKNILLLWHVVMITNLFLSINLCSFFINIQTRDHLLANFQMWYSPRGNREWAKCRWLRTPRSSFTISTTFDTVSENPISWCGWCALLRGLGVRTSGDPDRLSKGNLFYEMSFGMFRTETLSILGSKHFPSSDQNTFLRTTKSLFIQGWKRCPSWDWNDFYPRTETLSFLGLKWFSS